MMNQRLKDLENQSIFLLREAYANFENLAMLWSIGKDSTVLLWLARKAFLGHIPFPLLHIDTEFKIQKMIEYRNKLAMNLGIQLLVGKNEKVLGEKLTFPAGAVSRIECCGSLKTNALNKTLNGTWKRQKLNLTTGEFEVSDDRSPFSAAIVGVRSDEEGSRSKERYFSARDEKADWNLERQAPEFWGQYNTDFAPGSHVRVHPLLDWTELDIWEYIEANQIPIIDLYFDNGNGKRFRSLGCYPCTEPIESSAKNVSEIISELKSGKLKNIAERSGRSQDKEDGGGLETLRRKGYM